MWEPPRESLNHGPTELCPHPEWWTAWNPVSTEVEVSMLVAAFVKALQPEFVVEIGSHYGQTTERIGNVLKENGHGEIVSLEIDYGLHGSASVRCAGFPKEIMNIILVDSLQYIPPKPIDILFIDGHEDNRAKDLAHYMPYLSPHATVLVHDTDYYLEQTRMVLEMWKGEHITLHTPRGLLILTR